MPKLPRLLRIILTALVIPGILVACTPQYNWRQIRGEAPGYIALLPAKPAAFTRHISLGEHQLAMAMTAAETDNTTFAIGTLSLPPPWQADTVIPLMAQSLADNIAGKAKPAELPKPATHDYASTDMVIIGMRHGQPTQLLVRFVVVGQEIFQVLALRTGKDVDAEQAETFFTSFIPAAVARE